MFISRINISHDVTKETKTYYFEWNFIEIYDHLKSICHRVHFPFLCNFISLTSKIKTGMACNTCSSFTLGTWA